VNVAPVGLDDQALLAPEKSGLKPPPSSSATHALTSGEGSPAVRQMASKSSSITDHYPNRAKET